MKKLLPNPVILKLMQYKHIVRIKLHQHNIFEHEKNKLSTLNSMDSPPILLAGYQKSGNTWLRFLIFNYINIVKNEANKTLSYSELNNLFQTDEIGLPNDYDEKNNPLKGPINSYPYIVRTHSPFKKNNLYKQKSIRHFSI